MKGLPGDLLQEIRQTLVDCGPFDDPVAIKDLFLDERLALWAYSIPAGSYPQARVNALVTFLYNKPYDTPNPLLRFIVVLSESHPPESGCRKQTVTLANKLADYLGEDRPEIAGETTTPEAKSPAQEPKPVVEIRLSGPQSAQFSQALRDAYPGYDELEQMLYFQLDKNLEDISVGDPMPTTVYKLIKVAQANGWLAELIVAARKSNPGNSELAAFAGQFNLD